MTPRTKTAWTREEVESLETAALLGLYRHLTGKTTTKFASRAKGVEQTWAAVVKANRPIGRKPAVGITTGDPVVHALRKGADIGALVAAAGSDLAARQAVDRLRRQGATITCEGTRGASIWRLV